MTLLGSVDIPFTKSTKIAVDATDTAGQAATVAQQATDTAGQAQVTAQTASHTATQAAATAADAAQAAQTAITTANGKNKAYYGATTPTNPQSGDIWFVEDGNNNVTAIKHYDGTQWVTDVDNTALAQQISAAQAAADNAATVGQAAQQTAADAEAKGDAAAQAAEEAKDAATKAQADAASAVTSANNAVNTANKATQDAQDAIDKAQEGFDTAQDALSKADAAVDTANTAKQVASDAATQASTAKTNAQTAMSNAQDAINKANAANANANTREKSIIKSNTAPSNPATDQLWIDTSKTPQIMRRWNGSTWVDLSPTQASQIGAVSTTTYTTDITNINNTLSQKASVTTVNTLSGRVDSAETAITQNANAIARKADKTVVDTLKSTVDNHSTLISQNADAIALKANASTVDTLTGRVSTAEATLKTQANEIAARITKTDADAKYATQTALTATANSLTSSITAVQTNLDNLQIGGTNLVGNFNVNYPLPTITSNSKSGFGIHLNGDGSGRVFGPLNLKQNQYYTISFTAWWTGENGTGKMYCDLFPDTLPESPDWTVTTTPTKYYWTTASSHSDITNCWLRFWKLDSGDVYITDIKLEVGNKPTDWSPAPEDMATVAQFNTLSQTLDSTVSRIGNAEGNISALQQTANSFATRISNAEGNISTLTQTTQGLQSTVSGKVDTTTYNSFVTQTNSALQSKLSATDAANTYATQSQLTQTASSLQNSITQIQSSGSNLVIDPSWEINGNTSEKYHSGSKSLKVIANGYIQDIPLMTVTTSGGRMFYAEVWVLAGQSSWDGVVGLQVSEYNSRTNSWNWPTIQDLPANGGQTWTKLSGYVTVPDGYDKITIRLSVRESVTNGAVFYFDDAFVTEVSGVQSQISQLADDINLRVQKGDVINQINVSTEGILIDGKKVHITGQTTIDNAVIKDAMIQSMTANKLTAGTIDANVITVKNINASNIVTGTLDASKVTVANIDASKITTGTLNAARIAAGSIDASKLNVTSLSALSANLGSVTAGNISGVNINIGNGNFTVDTAGNLVAKNANITGKISGSTINGSDFYSSGENGSTHIYDNTIENFENISEMDKKITIISSGDIQQLYKVSDSIYKESSLSAGYLYIYNVNSGGETTIDGGKITAGNILLNGNHSIISLDGGGLFFTNANGDRIDINAKWVRPNNMAFGYHTIASLDGEKLFFTNNTSNGNRIDIGIATLDYSGSLSKSSSETLKSNIEPISFSAINEIMKTDFYSYNYISDLDRGITKPNFGPVIGDKYHLSDKFLSPDGDSVSIDNATFINSQAIKELYKDIQKQNQQIVLKIADLEARLAKLEE
ncbi:gp58-like family protein [Heyndrickxia coagulans]|uniref:gp58-like family protein n=1 Tax=Heyndrickxia coagulans TaxID=1398 RepID=UPI00062877A1|nr:gp58-like family protein [Heyndrickxia coagulans]